MSVITSAIAKQAITPTTNAYINTHAQIYSDCMCAKRQNEWCVINSQFDNRSIALLPFDCNFFLVFCVLWETFTFSIIFLYSHLNPPIWACRILKTESSIVVMKFMYGNHWLRMLVHGQDIRNFSFRHFSDFANCLNKTDVQHGNGMLLTLNKMFG